MNCGNYQEQILLMVHGELGFVDQVRVKAHLSRCVKCRAARDTFAATSHLIGAAIRSQDMTPWVPNKVSRSIRIPSTRTTVALLIIIGTSAFVAFTYYR